MKTFSQKAFTLIELLIVIGIIALLAVTVLLALNPAEAQRKNRDAKRIRDAGTLEAILIQLVDSPRDLSGDDIANDGVTSETAGNETEGNEISQDCTDSWLGVDVCNYVKTVPLDPQNGLTRTFQTGLAAPDDTDDGPMYYRAIVSGANYEIGVRQESVDNISKLTGDGGDDPGWFEVYSGDNELY